MILVIGSFMVDCVTRCERAPQSGETILGFSYENFLGGKGANQAVAARRLGSEVVFAGMLGNDSFGDRFLKKFEEEGIDTSYIRRSNLHTGIGSITLEKSGQNRIVIIPGANLDYTIKNLWEIEEKIKEANVVVAQLEMKIEVIQELGRICKRYQKTFILNPAPAQMLDDELLSSVTFLTPNETELAFLTKSKCESLDEIKNNAEKLLAKGVENVIVTLGDKGALLVNSSEASFHQGYKVHVVDTVAAGDSFNGALAHAINKNLNISQAVKLGNVVGSLTVQKKGAIPSLPFREDVLNIVKNLKNI